METPITTILHYKSYTEFTYGRVYVCDNVLVYEFPDATMEDVIARACLISFPFADDRIHEKFNWQVPSRGTRVISKTDRLFAIIDKHPDFMLLADVMKHEIPVETSVWMFNRLYALGCYMSMIGVYNLDISPYTALVNLKDHSLQLLGGWWYSVRAGEKLSRMPLATYNLLTNKMKDTKTATIEIVTEQIKSLMRKILEGRDIPAPYRNWLSLPAQENIVDEYSQWKKK